MSVKNQKLIDDLYQFYIEKKVTIDTAFEEILKIIVQNFDANWGLIYFEDDSVLVDLKYSKNAYQKNKSILPVYATEYILGYTYFKNKKIHPKDRILESVFKFGKTQLLSESISFQTLPSSELGIDNPNPEPSMIYAFQCLKTIFAFSLNKPIEVCPNYKNDIANFLEYSTPIVEIAVRRQIENISKIITFSSEDLYAWRNIALFPNSFNEICNYLQIGYGILIAKGISMSENSSEIICSCPNHLWRNDKRLIKTTVTLSQRLFEIGKSCCIPDTYTLLKNNNLEINYNKNTTQDKILRDFDISDCPKTLMCNFSKEEDGIQYLLLSARSKKSSAKLFNIFERKMGQEIVDLYRFSHKIYANSHTVAKNILDLKHEINQKLVVINSATSYVKKSLAKRNVNFVLEERRIEKLDHIKNTASEILRIMSNISISNSIGPEETNQNIFPIKLYSDLVKPICASFSEQAKMKGIYFTYYGTDQLGLAYISFSQLRTVIEIFITNLIKYTYPDNEALIAFERISNPEGIV